MIKLIKTRQTILLTQAVHDNKKINLFAQRNLIGYDLMRVHSTAGVQNAARHLHETKRTPQIPMSRYRPALMLASVEALQLKCPFRTKSAEENNSLRKSSPDASPGELLV